MPPSTGHNQGGAPPLVASRSLWSMRNSFNRFGSMVGSLHRQAGLPSALVFVYLAAGRGNWSASSCSLMTSNTRTTFFTPWMPAMRSLARLASRSVTRPIR